MPQDKTRIVSIDYGLARIGMAISDETHLLASNLPTLQVEKKCEKSARDVARTVQDLEKERGCRIPTLVVGLPLMMNGKQGLMADEVLHFISLLKELGPWDVVTWDERLSSVQADRSLREGNLNRKKRAKKVDSVTAVIILQNYLDRQNDVF